MAPPTSNELAMERTRLAHERTLMAWVRTSTSLISFGFTMYKFFQYMMEQGTSVRIQHFLGPREFGIVMIFIGIASLLVGTIQHHVYMRALRKTYGKMPRSWTAILAYVMLALGAALLIAAMINA